MKNQEKLWKTNKLICGDNLEELAKFPKESIDLIYIDPPYFTHKKYEVIWGDEAEVRSYKDKWEGYPTQKPEALLERIIKIFSNKDDVVCDPFCGCGTTIAVAQVLQRII